MPRWNGSDFAIDCISLIVTLIPFTLMSYSYDKDLMNKAGIIPFFLAYALLLFVSLLLLLVVRLKYLLSLITYKPATTVAADEETRYTALTLHWFFVNGIAIVVLMIGFDWLNADHGPCAASMKGPPLWFIELFTFVALLRNYVDFATVWPFLYINKREELPEDLPWFSRGIMGWAMRQPLAHCVTLSDGSTRDRRYCRMDCLSQHPAFRYDHAFVPMTPLRSCSGRRRCYVCSLKRAFVGGITAAVVLASRPDTYHAAVKAV
jgi:hypothetical protein